MGVDLIRDALILKLSSLSQKEARQLARLLLMLEPTNMEVGGFVLQLLDI